MTTLHQRTPSGEPLEAWSDPSRLVGFEPSGDAAGFEPSARAQAGDWDRGSGVPLEAFESWDIPPTARADAEVLATFREPLSFAPIAVSDLEAVESPVDSSRNPTVDAELRALRAFVHALHTAVQARRLYGSTAAAARFVDRLAGLLAAHLDAHEFLSLHVKPGGFAFRAVAVQLEEKHDIAESLARDGILELIFKRGVTHAELTRLVDVLHASADMVSVEQSVATLLWEANLEHVVFCCADELPSRDVLPLDLSAQQHPVSAAESLGIEELRAAETTMPGAKATAVVPVSAASESRELRFESTNETLEQLARLLVDLHVQNASHTVSNPAEVPQPAVLPLLGDYIEVLLHQRRLLVLRDALAWMRARAAREGGEALAAALEHALERLCAERNVLQLGAVLDDAHSAADDVAAVREILIGLDGAVQPLCTMLVRLENMQARKLVCHVLATVAAGDPGVLAQRASGEPWYVARNMAWVMGRIGGPAVLPHLKRWSHHEDLRVRTEVARAFGKVQHSASGTLLCDMLSDDEPRVRQSAVWSLARLGDRRVLPRLREILFEDRGFRSRRPEERDDFFRTYGRLANDPAFAELIELLEQRSLVGRGWQAELRRGAALALGEMQRPDAVRLLQKYARSRDERLREGCLAALRAIKNRGSVAVAPQRESAAPEPVVVPANASFQLEVSDDE